MARNQLARRTLLSAVGLGVGAQLLRSRTPALAQSGARVPRLFILFIPHGLPWEHFDPVGTNQELDFAASGIGGLTPLEPYRELVNVVRGCKMAGDAHDHHAIRAALTGAADGGSVDSIDYVIAKRLGLTPHVLGAAPYRDADGFTQASFLAKHGGVWVRALESPVLAADRIFGAAADLTGEFDEAAFEAQALELAEAQVKRAASATSRLQNEVARLNLHLEALRDLQQSGQAQQGSACAERPPLPALSAIADLHPLDESHFGEIFDAHLEVAAEAMVCGAARVITLQTMFAGSPLRFDFQGGPGLPSEHHLGLSHLVEPRQPYAEAQRFLLERLANKLLSVLAQPDPLDPEHSVLDNSLVYVISEVSDGSAHNSDARDVTIIDRTVTTFLPQLLIGGAAGYLKPGGRIVQVEKNRPHGDVLATLAAAMGAPVSEIGGQPVSEVEELKA